ncbi:MAG: hypothetical protein EXR75_16595 [Myxococcales bacterium]|nr:hypothetical protein [Myxococcales bacterium]
MGGEALDLFRAGDYAAALVKFETADALVPAPTLKLHAARCLDKLGRMSAAAAQYRSAIAVELKPWAPKVHVAARDAAVSELAKVLDLMPTLAVSVTGAEASRVTVTLQGAPLASATLGEAQRLDPGSYTLVATSGTLSARQDVELARADRRSVVLALVDSVKPRLDDGPSVLAMVGFGALGVGAAGLVVGGVAGGIVVSDEARLALLCPDRRCFPKDHADAASFERTRMASSIGFFAGGALGAGGAVLLILDALGTLDTPGESSDPAANADASARVMPFIAPAGVGITGWF